MSATAPNFVAGTLLGKSLGGRVTSLQPSNPLLATQRTWPRSDTTSSSLFTASSGRSLAISIGLFCLALGASSSKRSSGQRLRRKLRAGAQQTVVATSETELPQVDRSKTKKFRKDFMKSDQYFRFGKAQMDEAMAGLKAASGSVLLDRIRANGFQLTIGDITFVLAESYGFCWGVERTLAMAYEARRYFPDSTIWLTNEIIHNAVVNRDLQSMGMRFVPRTASGGKDFSCIQEGDVCVLPAFGASVDEMAYLKDKGVQVVDTTCPWVAKVWNAVEKGKGRQHTTVIHGKYAHEETVATKSFADKYIVVKNIKEAEYVANYVLGSGGTREEFMEKFSHAMSDGFDPDTDLEKVGVANQTTMLKGETELIGKLFERVMLRKYGPQAVNDHFLSFNTICDATQERQNAIYKMFDAEYEPPTSKLYTELEGEQVGLELKSKSREESEAYLQQESSEGVPAPPTHVDLGLVVGGYNSSNTLHLIEIPMELGVMTYHIDCALRIGGTDPDSVSNVIQHKPLTTSTADAMLDKGLDITEGFLPDGPITIGVTAGASTPDSSVGDCLERILAIRGIDPTA